VGVIPCSCSPAAWEFDRDRNGLVEGPELEGLYAWEDLDGNGVADPGEVASLRELGIIYLSITHVNYQSVYYRYLNGNGSPGSGTLWDWWPNYAIVNREPGAAVSRSTPARVGHLQLRALRGLDFSARPSAPPLFRLSSTDERGWPAAAVTAGITPRSTVAARVRLGRKPSFPHIHGV
jgi:hypothetical protein